VTVGVDYRHDRLARAMGKIKVESGARRSGRSKCVDDDDAGPTLYDLPCSTVNSRDADKRRP
jgi:hypothetical protein